MENMYKLIHATYRTYNNNTVKAFTFVLRLLFWCAVTIHYILQMDHYNVGNHVPWRRLASCKCCYSFTRLLSEYWRQTAALPVTPISISKPAQSFILPSLPTPAFSTQSWCTIPKDTDVQRNHGQSEEPMVQARHWWRMGSTNRDCGK